ncbi:MAG: MutS-related protein, partial [Candidatus Binatia bacterium]
MLSPDSSAAREEYQRRLAERQRRAAELAAAERRIGNWRLVIFVGAAALALAAFGFAALPAVWLAVPLIAFGALVLAHTRVIPARRQAARAVQYFERGLARLDDRWAGQGEPGLRFVDPAHPYAGDLDLFGAGSLFELLCTARTRAGEDTLAAWLGAAAPPAEIVARQAALAELQPRVDLREALALLG